MISFKKQVGGALIGYMLLATAGAGLAAYYGVNKMKSDYEIDVINESALKMEQLQSAQLQCYNDARRWCTQAEMTAYYRGDNQIIGGDSITYSIDGRNLLFSVDILDVDRAQRLSQLVVAPSVTGTFVRSTIRPPTDASIFSERLQRYENAIDSDRIVMATNLNMGGNDVNNAENVFSQTMNVGTTTADTLNTSRTIVSNELDIEGNRIVSAGTDIEIYASTVKPSGTVTLGQNMFGTSTSNMTGFTNVDGDEGVFENTTTDTLIAENGSIDTLIVDVANADNLIASTGNISNTNITNLTFGTANGNRLNTTSLDVNNTLAGSQITATDGTFGTLNSTTASIESGTISDVTSTAIITNELNAASAQFVDLQSGNTVSNTASSGSVVANGANIGSLITTSLSANSGDATSTISSNLTANNANISGALSGNSLNAGSGTIGTLNATTLDATSAGTVNLNDLVSTNIDVDNLIGTDASIVNVIVNNTLISDRLIANVATIAMVEANSTTITNGDFYKVNATNGTAGTANLDTFDAVNASFGNLNANGITANNANIINFNVDTLNASGTTTINTMNANSFSGGQFYASGDFNTGQSSVNANAGGLGLLQNEINNCVNVSKYCIPSSPEVSLICTNCNRSSDRSNFSGYATANISVCPQGCSFSWNTSGSRLAFSSCPSGSIPPGGSASPTCSVSATLDSQASANGSMSINVVNAHYPSKTATRIASISFTNSSPLGITLSNEISLNSISKLSGGTSNALRSQAYETATASITISSAVENPVVVVTLDTPNCIDEPPPVGTTKVITDDASGEARITVRVTNGSAGSNAYGKMSCTANFSFVITASNSPDTLTLSGILDATAEVNPNT
jgi:hypothetical protein